MKPLCWVASALEDLRSLPSGVQDQFGYALYLAQVGGKHPNAKPLTRFKAAGVLEIVENFDGNTYRAVYAAKFENAIYVLHVFQKKSKRGIATPKLDLELIETRLKYARVEASKK